MSLDTTLNCIRFRNFMSYGNAWTEINFTDFNAILTFISGENHDTGGKNGCGKSSILEAIVYAIYNKAFSNISLPRLINSTNAAKNTLMEVIVTFTKGADAYEIHRKRGEAHGVKLLKNGVDITPDSVNETDVLIESIYGLSYELFTRCIVFSGNTTPFLDLPIAFQRAHIEELFNISLLSEKAVKLKRSIQNTESDIKVEEAILKEKETAYKLQANRLADVEEKAIAWEENNVRNIQQLKKQLASIEGIDFSAEEKQFNSLAETKELLTEVKSTLAAERRALQRLSTSLIEAEKSYSHLADNNCPYCKQLMPNAADKLPELKAAIKHQKVEAEEKAKTVFQLEEAEAQLSGEFSELDSKIKYSNLPALLEIKSNHAVLHAKLDGLEASINPHLETYALLEQETKIEIDYSKLDKSKKRLEHQQFMLKLLTDKNSFIRKRIISKTVPFLNLQMNDYAEQLGLPHTISFMDDMSCEVSEYGRVLDFGNLSNGEKKRVNLAMSLAFRDVLHHLHSNINLLFVDEIDASLDFMGVDNVIALLKKKTKDENLTSFIVMHRENVENRFERELVVHKKQGFSQLELKFNDGLNSKSITNQEA